MLPPSTNKSGVVVISSQQLSFGIVADQFAKDVDEPLLTLLGVTRTLAGNPAGPDAHRLADSAARNAALIARLIADLQAGLRRVHTPARRQMIEVLPAIRTSLSGLNVHIEGDEALVAIADANDFRTLLAQIVATAAGRTVVVEARRADSDVRITIRPAFPERPIDLVLVRTLAAPLGPVALGVDGSITLTLPAFAMDAGSTGPRWWAAELSSAAAR